MLELQLAEPLAPAIHFPLPEVPTEEFLKLGYSAATRRVGFHSSQIHHVIMNIASARERARVAGSAATARTWKKYTPHQDVRNEAVARGRSDSEALADFYARPQLSSGENRCSSRPLSRGPRRP